MKCKALLALFACLFTLLFVACRQRIVTSGVGTAPAISCNDIAGEYVSLGLLKGKVIVLYFWSSTCCGDKLKQLEPFYLSEKYNNLSIIAVEVGGTKDRIASLVNTMGLTFTNMTDEYESISRSYKVIGFPTIFVIDKKGGIRKKISGDISVEDLRRIVSPLLAE
jgi:peroxiredoxin